MISADNAAHIFVARETRISELDVFHSALNADVAEQPLMLIRAGVARQAADRIAPPVKRAEELIQLVFADCGMRIVCAERDVRRRLNVKP